MDTAYIKQISEIEMLKGLSFIVNCLLFFSFKKIYIVKIIESIHPANSLKPPIKITDTNKNISIKENCCLSLLKIITTHSKTLSYNKYNTLSQEMQL